MKKGFTLIEVLISLLILAFVISGFIATVVVSVQSFRLSKARYFGTKIAEEGIELVINKRDNNIICVKSGTCPQVCSWKEGLLKKPSSSASCSSLNSHDWNVDTTKADQLLAGNFFDDYSSSSKICIKAGSQNQFGVCSGAEIPITGDYNRKIEITELTGEPAVKIRSIVTWKSKGSNYGVTLEQILFGLP